MAVEFKWSDFSTAWQAALEETWAAFVKGSYPIGAAITDANGEIIARGRNHINDRDGLRGQQVGGVQFAHAELNALLVLPSDMKPEDLHAAHIYTTVEPCPLCVGAIYMSGIRNIHYASRDPYAGSIDILGNTQYMSRKPIRVEGPLDPDIDTVMLGLMVAYHKAIDEKFASSAVYIRWQKKNSRGVAFGERLANQGLLETLRGNQATAEHAISALFTFYHENHEAES